MSSRTILATATALAVALLLSPAASFGQPPVADAIRATLSSAEPSAPGCAMGVFDGATKRVYASGYADLAARRPIDADTQFYLASVSKQFTSLAAAQLIVAGKLSPGDDVRAWIPELPRYRTKVTVEMLMHHISGVRDQLGLLRMSGVTDYGSLGRRDGLALLFRQAGTDFVPGTRYEYSNGGYLLLSEVVARASGETFANYVGRHILGPIGMRRSFILDGIRPSDRNLARGYTPQGDGFDLRDSYPLYGGAGGLISTINDFARYHHDITVGHKVWTPAVTALMEAPGKLADGSPNQMTEVNAVYGAGLMLGDEWIEHGGDAEGFKSNYARRKDRPFGIAVFCNRGDFAPTDKTDAALTLLGTGLSAVRSVPLPPASANGRFYSDELRTEYRLATRDGIMMVTRDPADFPQAAPPELILKRLVDGSYVSDDRRMRILLDPDGAGFLVDYWRAQGIHFRRVD